MTTMDEVARHAGVSKATVSRLLNNKGYVNAQTAARIEDAVRKLGYRPNRIASSLHTRQSLNIAMVINDISNPITAAYVKGAEETSSKYGYNFILCNTGFEIEKEIRYINSLVEKRVDGIILSPCGDSKSHVEEAISMNIPITFITRRLLGINADYVRLDNLDGSYQLARHLIDKGYRRIGVVGRKIHDDDYTNRLGGYKAAMDEAGILVDDRLGYYGDASIDAGYNAMTTFEESGELPDAVYTTTSMQAVGVIRYCKERYLKLPGDIALASFESFLEFDNIIDPMLTTYIAPYKEMGIQAAELLFERVLNSQTKCREVSLAGYLRVAESTE